MRTTRIVRIEITDDAVVFHHHGSSFILATRYDSLTEYKNAVLNLARWARAQMRENPARRPDPLLDLPDEDLGEDE